MFKESTIFCWQLIVYKYWRFLFSFPSYDLSTATVIKHLLMHFSLLRVGSYINFDRGSSFMSWEPKGFLQLKGIATSQTIAYNPQENVQQEMELFGKQLRWFFIPEDSKYLSENQYCKKHYILYDLFYTSTNATAHKWILYISENVTMENQCLLY